MELRHLRYFVAVAEELSFRRAALRLHLSQPALTRQIQALEEELRVQLLERNRRRQVLLTAAGRSFLLDAKDILDRVPAAGRRAHAAQRGKRERLKLAAVGALSVKVLPDCLRAFHAAYPRVEVSLIEMDRSGQMAALRKGRVDLALFPGFDAPLEPGLESRTLLTCPIVAVLPLGHRLAKNKKSSSRSLKIQDLSEDTLITPSAELSHGFVQSFDEVCRVTNFRPASIHQVDGPENVLGMVAGGYGIAILPEMLITRALPKCVIRPLRPPVPPFHLKLLWQRENPSVVLQNFVEVVTRLLPCVSRPVRDARNVPGKHR